MAALQDRAPRASEPMHPADEIRTRNRTKFDGAFGSTYSYCMDRPWLGRAVGMAFWGGDSKPFYDSLRAIGQLPEGSVVADAPCGAGVAFDALSPRQRVRYLALDLSPFMLERARHRARTIALTQIAFIEGDAERMPLANGSVDLFLSYQGLECMPHPDAAVREIARCLRRDGRLIGYTICHGPSLRQRLFVRKAGAFGPCGTVDDLARWINSAGLTLTRLEVSGAFAFFEASA